MKVMVVSPYFYPKVGGLEKYVWYMSQGLKNKYGCEVVAVTSNHLNRKTIVEEIDGVKIYRLPYLFTLSNTPINPFWAFNLKNIISKEHPDVINAHAPVPFMSDITAMVSDHIPYTLTYHSGSMKKNNFLIDIPISLYEKVIFPITLNKASKIICSSHFIQRSMFKNSKIPVTVINPGVDTNIFKPSSAPKDPQTILFIGNQKAFYELKGLHTLIEAISPLSHVKLKVVGERDEPDSSRIEYLGYKSQQDLVKEIQRSNIVVLPSLLQEGFGTVLVEAMACKTPVIGSRIGGISEVIDHGHNGFLCEPGDAVTLRTQISTLLTDQKLSERFIKNGYDKVINNFTWDRQIEKTYNVLSSLIL